MTHYYNRVVARRAGSARPVTSQRAVSSNSNFQLPEADYTTFLSGLSGLMGNITNIVSQDLGLNQQAPELVRSDTGQPVYTGGAAYNTAYLSKPQGAVTAEELLGGVAAGAAAGSVFSPGGAVVGGVIAGLGTALAGGERRRRQQAERSRALRQVRTYQQDFNRATESFDKQQLALSDYYRRLNNEEQLYNLFRI